MRTILIVSALLCAGASPGGCGGGGATNRGGEIAPGTPLDIPFGNYQIIAYHANQAFAAAGVERFVYATDLQYRLAAGLPVFVLDVRGAIEFDDRHIPTAVNVPAADLFTSTGLAGLPVDGTVIVVVGADAHSSSMITGVLATMGYPARALLYGMMGWKSSSPAYVYSASQRPATISGLGGPLVQ